MLGFLMALGIVYVQYLLGVFKIDSVKWRWIGIAGPYIVVFGIAYLVHLYRAVWKMDQDRYSHIVLLIGLLDDFKSAGRLEVLADEAEQLRLDIMSVGVMLKSMSPSDLQRNHHLSRQRSDLNHAYHTHRLRAWKYRTPSLTSDVLGQYTQLPNRDWDELAQIMDRHKYALKSLSDSLSRQPVTPAPAKKKALQSPESTKHEN